MFLADAHSLDIALEFAVGGDEAFDRVVESVDSGMEYALALIDLSPAEGVDTIEHLWCADPELQVALCAALSDDSRSNVLRSEDHQ